jgi:peptidoglycan/LPS O-acetylase OafA/YrhL
MLHWPAILILRAVAWPDGAAWTAGLITLGVATTVLCWAVHRWYDRPMNRRRARWVEARRLPAPVPGMPQPTKGDDSVAAFA